MTDAQHEYNEIIQMIRDDPHEAARIVFEHLTTIKALSIKLGQYNSLLNPIENLDVSSNESTIYGTIPEEIMEAARRFDSLLKIKMVDIKQK